MKITGIILVSLIMVYPMATAHPVQCGDMNGNGTVDVSDLVSLVAYMFQSGPSPEYLPAADCDGSGSLDISDIVCWVEWMFGGGQTPPACPIHYLQNHEEFSSGCLPEPSPGKDAAERVASGGYLYLELEGNNLHVHHMEAFYQCCLEYRVSWYQSGQVLTGFEADTGALCDCYCDFNLESVLYGLDPGDYTVVLIGIEGDTVGVDEITVPGGAPSVIDYGDTGCLELISPPDSAIVDYTLSGDTLNMVHHNGWFNCGGIIATEFSQTGDTLRFYEFNVSEDWMYCMCYFRVWATVAGIESGTCVAEIYARDLPEEPIQLIDRRTVILEN